MSRFRNNPAQPDEPRRRGKSQSRQEIASRSSETPSRPKSSHVPPGTPAWVTAELIDLTIGTWQPYYRSPLSPDDAVTMILNVGRLYEVLSGDRGP